MVSKLTTISTKHLNCLPANGGVLTYYSAHVIMHVSPLDYENKYQIKFGAYVQVYEEPQPYNTQLGRNIETIYLEPMLNKQGGHVLMNLNTAVEVTWHGNIAELPITDVIIKYLENMDSRKTTKVINIQNREKVIYNTNNWIA